MEPWNYLEASTDPNWIRAMNDELEALYLNKTQEMTNLPPNTKEIGYNWVFKIKYKSNGEVQGQNCCKRF